MIREKLQKIQFKRLVILNLPYLAIFYVADKGSWLYRHCLGESMVQRLGVMLVNFRLAFLSWLPSLHLQDLTVGIMFAGCMRLQGGETEKISNHSWTQSLKTMSF